MHTEFQDDLRALLTLLESKPNMEACTRDELVDLYLLLSEVASTADDLRKTVGDTLDVKLDAGERAHGNIGHVRSVERTRRDLRDEKTVYERFEAVGISPEVLSAPDPDKVEDALDITDVSESDVFEESSYTYVRRDHVSDAEKRRIYGNEGGYTVDDE